MMDIFWLIWIVGGVSAWVVTLIQEPDLFNWPAPLFGVVMLFPAAIAGPLNWAITYMAWQDKKNQRARKP